MSHRIRTISGSRRSEHPLWALRRASHQRPRAIRIEIIAVKPAVVGFERCVGTPGGNSIVVVKRFNYSRQHRQILIARWRSLFRFSVRHVVYMPFVKEHKQQHSRLRRDAGIMGGHLPIVAEQASGGELTRFSRRVIVVELSEPTAQSRSAGMFVDRTVVANSPTSG